MAELSATPAERARKAHSMILAALSPTGTASNLAQIMGVSEPVVSRTKNEKLEDALVLLYHLGFKVVESSRMCVSKDRYDALVTIAGAAMSCPDTARKLIWEAD